MKLALKESSQNVNMTNDLVTGGFQKITFQYETPCTLLNKVAIGNDKELWWQHCRF